MEIKLEKFLPKKNRWIILLLVGILLVVIALPTDKKTGIRQDANSLLGSDRAGSDTYSTDTETRLTNLLSQIEGVGDVQVMITYQEDKKVQGIVVLAEGGENAVVVRNITGVVQALFDVNSHKIKVIEKNQNK